MVRQLADASIGECTQRGEMNPRRTEHGWFHDCRTYADWCAAGQPLGEASAAIMPSRFDMRRIAIHLDYPETAPVPPPAFIVVPDMVAAGAASLAFSAYWRDDIDPRVPAYVAVQNGMTEDEVGAAIDEQCYGGVFVGATPRGSSRPAPPGSGSRTHAGCRATSAASVRPIGFAGPAPSAPIR
jgi:hypothetical protein